MPRKYSFVVSEPAGILSYLYPVDSRKLLYVVGGVVGVVLVVIIWSSLSGGSSETGPQPGSTVLRQAPLIVGSNYFLTNLNDLVHNQVSKVKFDQDLKNDTIFGTTSCKSCQTDLSRLKSGLVGSQIWSIDVPCAAEYKDAVALTLERVDAIHRLIKQYPNSLSLVTSSIELSKNFKEKQVSSILAVTSGHSIDGRMPVLRMLYDMGVRVMSLTSSCSSDWASSYSSTTDSGLSTFGQDVVKEMNRLGIVIDLSESSYNTQLGVLNITKTPVIFSRAAAYTLFNNNRNVKDDVLEKLKLNKGLVMVTFAQQYISNNVKNASISSVIDHINYFKGKLGVTGVGIGAEYDGESLTFPPELSDVSTFPVLFDQLGNTWTNRDDLKNLAGGNLLRVLQAAEEYAKKVQNSPADETYQLPVLQSNATCYSDFSSRNPKSLSETEVPPSPQSPSPSSPSKSPSPDVQNPPSSNPQGGSQNPPSPSSNPQNPASNPQNPPSNPQNPPSNPQNPPSNPQNPPSNPQNPPSNPTGSPPPQVKAENPSPKITPSPTSNSSQSNSPPASPSQTR
ncbi:dipeptidase 1-like isoform X2 [Homalodisca vitripennis]|uniref:dipeptidase 1-like isoform X2 n=1 Tax=Homalodisca vitripennis TaxID=197043 RepID=UPI001EEB78B6|nr:dipeptidase 1-like isoform X2 [Homalodisca vitripennis]